MATRTLVTSVFLSKAEALALLADVLDAPWNTEDGTDVTLEVSGGAQLAIEVPKFGEDLPLTLDLFHDDEQALEEISSRTAGRLREKLGWGVEVLALGK